MSRTSLTFPRSSRMAAETVRMCFTDGAERFSRSCSTESSTLRRSLRRNDSRTAGFEPALTQRFAERAHHPPELEDGLLGRHLLDLVRDGLEDLEILFGTF